MINSMDLLNFGPLESLKWKNLGQINLIIGGNGTGKTFLLKALYSTMRTIEEYKIGADKRTAAEILAEKLYWTFQPDKIGDLVTKGSEKGLNFSLKFNDRTFSYGFGKDTTKQILSLKNDLEPRTNHSIFLPAKEVLSLHQIILKSRELDKAFGFDDTYFDLAKALRISPKRGRNYKEFSESRKSLEQILGGRIEFEETSGNWHFKKGNQKFPIGVTAEGIKKIAIIDTLLGNHYLDANSIIFIDEPESSLHPEAVSKLLDIIAVLAKTGIQFFLASHSYFVIKKLFLIAQEDRALRIPVLSAHENRWTAANLADGMPENKIIDESIRLYKEEIGLTLK